MARGLTIFGALLVLAGLSVAAYLPDYEYIEGVGWLRLHIVPATWADAQLRCHLEDATLTAPTTSAITAVMKTTMRAHKLAASSVFTDLYASNPKGDFRSVNGLSMSNINLQWAVGEPNNLGNEEDCLVMTSAGELADVRCSSVHPFFCLKRNTTSNCEQRDDTYEANQSITQEAKACDTTDQGYTLNPHTGSCYKFHRAALPWRRAAMICASEHAHLAIIDSDVESDVLKEIFMENPKPTITSTLDNNYVHIGILDWNQEGEWLTVFGETLDAAVYNSWGSGEPSNSNNNEYCGAMSRCGDINDIPCTSAILPYICEISPKL